MRVFRTGVAAAAILWAAAVRAQDAQIVVKNRAAFDACAAKAVSTPDSEHCAEVEAARWDKRLNAAYGKIMASSDWSKATKDLVRDAQRAWLTYRKAKCSAASELEAEGGTLSRIVYGNCIADETALRAVELETALTQH